MKQIDYSNIGATELILSNGMRVCYKHTDFLDDQVKYCFPFLSYSEWVFGILLSFSFCSDVFSLVVFFLAWHKILFLDQSQHWWMSNAESFLSVPRPLASESLVLCPSICLHTKSCLLLNVIYLSIYFSLEYKPFLWVKAWSDTVSYEKKSRIKEQEVHTGRFVPIFKQ